LSPLAEALGGESLSLLFGIVATDISLDDNEGAAGDLWVVGGETKNASCSELGDENASGSELGVLQVLGAWRTYICKRLPGPLE